MLSTVTHPEEALRDKVEDLTTARRQGVMIMLASSPKCKTKQLVSEVEGATAENVHAPDPYAY